MDFEELHDFINCFLIVQELMNQCLMWGLSHRGDDDVLGAYLGMKMLQESKLTVREHLSGYQYIVACTVQYTVYVFIVYAWTGSMHLRDAAFPHLFLVNSELEQAFYFIDYGHFLVWLTTVYMFFLGHVYRFQDGCYFKCQYFFHIPKQVLQSKK